MTDRSLINKKFGMDPGTIVYTGERKDEKVEIEFFAYSPEDFHHEKNIDLSSFNLIPNKVNWLNFNGVNDIDLLKKIGSIFKIDNLILEDIANVNQRAKLERRTDFAYVVLKMYYLDKDKLKILSNQISLIIGENFLLSFQDGPTEIFDFIKNRITENLGLVRGKGADYLGYLMLDAIVDNYFMFLEKIEFETDSLEEEVIKFADKGALQKIFNLKQQFIMLKRAILTVREMVIKFDPRELRVLHADLDIFVEDLHDHVIIVHEIMENISTRITGLIELYHSSINNTMNETMRFLTIVSTIFVPLTFIAGLYGMNFHFIPELSFYYGYFYILGAMMTIASVMIYIFKKKKWF